MDGRVIKYRFEGVDAEGKKVGGFVFAEDEKQARLKITNSGYAVLSIEAYKQPEQRQSDLTLFEFEGHRTDTQKPVHGTIESEDEYTAYKKLRMDYALELKYLIPIDTPPNQREQLKTAGIRAELEEQLREEEKNFFKVQKETQSYELINETKRKEMDFYRSQIESLIIKVQQLMTEHESEIDPNVRHSIQERLDLLARLRQSNSVEHLDMLTKKLFVQLQAIELDVTAGAANLTDEQKKALIKLRTPKGFRKFLVKKEELAALDPAQIYKEEKEKKFREAVIEMTKLFKKGSSEIHVDFVEVGAKHTWNFIKYVDPLGNLFQFIYWTFAFLFCFLLIFWCLNGIKIILFLADERTMYIFRSFAFWFTTGLSGLVAIFFGPEALETVSLSLKRKSLLYGCAGVVIALYILQAPALFYWC